MQRACWCPALLGILLLVVAACDAVPSAPAARPAGELAGTWRWVSSFDVRTQRLHTPATEGFTAELHFRADSARSGTFTYYREGRPAAHGRFGIGSEGAPGNDFIVLEPGIDFLKRNAWVSVGRDSLRLGGVMEMGHNSVYARIGR